LKEHLIVFIKEFLTQMNFLFKKHFYEYNVHASRLFAKETNVLYVYRHTKNVCIYFCDKNNPFFKWEKTERDQT